MVQMTSNAGVRATLLVFKQKAKETGRGLGEVVAPTRVAGHGKPPHPGELSSPSEDRWGLCHCVSL